MKRDFGPQPLADITTLQVDDWLRAANGNHTTKGHWRAGSRMVDIDAGLKDLVATIRKLHIRSIAIPPLGCGNGGLDWDEVRPRIEAALAEVPDVEALVYSPAGAPEAAAMPVRTERPKMTMPRFSAGSPPPPEGPTSRH